MADQASMTLSDAIRAELEGAVLPLERVYADALGAMLDLCDRREHAGWFRGATVPTAAVRSAIAGCLGIGEEQQ